VADFGLRPARDDDRRALAELIAALAEERAGQVATEPPVDLDARAAAWRIEETIVAVAGERIVGTVAVERSRYGFGELSIGVAREWRGRGVGSALMTAAIECSREQGLHKLGLAVFPHNEQAIAVYRKFGFVEEGLRVKHLRRANGELWDALEMGLLL
jgi:RimJ/RimL family protein N-acetyltransferase